MVAAVNSPDPTLPVVLSLWHALAFTTHTPLRRHEQSCGRGGTVISNHTDTKFRPLAQIVVGYDMSTSL
ncbi:hypothetical protein AALO_G00278410 [Alosa alosa]|uniref:Secreted protein n=1 Tax=Alosa alosa TaxID=278164 RepID=A0AAV6FNS2_9TELE|nr:hypothetical protein AALO_G00278410 [Alosa alosa]